MYFNDVDSAITELSSREWKLLDSMVNLLKPVEAAPRMLSADKYGTNSLLLPMIAAMRVSLSCQPWDKQKDAVMFSMRDKLVSSLVTRFADVETNDIFFFAALLDPSMYYQL